MSRSRLLITPRLHIFLLLASAYSASPSLVASNLVSYGGAWPLLHPLSATSSVRACFTSCLRSLVWHRRNGEFRPRDTRLMPTQRQSLPTITHGCFIACSSALARLMIQMIALTSRREHHTAPACRADGLTGNAREKAFLDHSRCRSFHPSR